MVEVLDDDVGEHGNDERYANAVQEHAHEGGPEGNQGGGDGGGDSGELGVAFGRATLTEGGGGAIESRAG